jgi:hypothetical protein
MTLKEFLAVGRSFAESPREKSPFEMRKEIKLPTFENAPRFASRNAVPIQADWLTEPTHQPASFDAPPNPVNTPESKKSEPARRTTRKKSWLEIMTFGLFGKAKLAGELHQTELNLNKVRVIRNDLADSDLEVVVNKNKKFAMRPVKVEPQREAAPEPVAAENARAKTKRGQEWTELTAKLFEIGQQ